MNKLASTILCVMLTGVCAADDLGARLNTLLLRETVASLVSAGMVQNTTYREAGSKLRLTPGTPLAKEAASFWAGDPPPFTNETLYLYRKPAGRITAPGDDVQAVSVILRSLSRLEGIEYYSTSRKKMRTLYEKSYAVNSAEERKRIDDPVDGSADHQTILAVQKDLTFGEFLYRYSYRQTADSVAFFSSNADPLSYSLMKLVGPDHLRISLVVQDLGDFFLVYNVTRADFPALPGIEGKLKASFTTRAEAVYTWFIREYERK